MWKHVQLVIVFTFFFCLFLFRSSITKDPDFGWHIQFGRLVTSTHTIPVTDPYSYSMPSYHFVNHEWGMDIIVANIYDHFGIWPLIFVFSFVGITALFILYTGNDKRFVTVPLFLVGGTLFDFVGVHPQVIALLFLAGLSVVVYQKLLWQRFRFFLPLVFFVWANLHGSFAIGIVIIGIVIAVQMIEKRQFSFKDSLVFLLSLFATLINPYGYHLWTEVLNSAADSQLRLWIQEWYPAIYFENIAFWIYTTLSLFLIVRYYRKFSISTIVLYGFLFISGMANMRNIPVFVMLAFFPTVHGIKLLSEEAGTYLYGKKRFLKAYYIFLLVCLIFFLPQLVIFTFRILVFHELKYNYPKDASAYLRNHLPAGQIFSSYDWGGYLIWQLPEKKVFIDGRMPSWHNAAAPYKESENAFKEYQLVLENNIPFTTFSKKYGITTLLISPNDLLIEKQIVFGIDFEKTPVLKYFVHPGISFIYVVDQVKKMGWKEVYHDQDAVIYEKT